jgi:CRP-like cAMP-binding protein
MISPLIAALQTKRPIVKQDQHLILSWFTERTVKSGEVLLQGGQICRELFFICKGVLRLGTTDDNGQDITYFFLKENQFATILKSFNEGVIARESISAACDAVVLSITKTSLLELYKSLPWLKTVIEDMQHKQLMEKISLKNSFQGRDALSNYEAFIQQFPDIALRVPLKDVASFLGITPQSLSRLRKNHP